MRAGTFALLLSGGALVARADLRPTDLSGTDSDATNLATLVALDPQTADFDFAVSGTGPGLAPKPSATATGDYRFADRVAAKSLSTARPTDLVTAGNGVNAGLQAPIGPRTDGGGQAPAPGALLLGLVGLGLIGRLPRRVS